MWLRKLFPRLSPNRSELLDSRCRVSWRSRINMREIVHIQAGQCGNQIGAKVRHIFILFYFMSFPPWNDFVTFLSKRSGRDLIQQCYSPRKIGIGTLDSSYLILIILLHHLLNHIHVYFTGDNINHIHFSILWFSTEIKPREAEISEEYRHNVMSCCRQPRLECVRNITVAYLTSWYHDFVCFRIIFKADVKYHSTVRISTFNFCKEEIKIYQGAI